MKILVTGSSGYVGSMLVPFLLGDDHDVVGYDLNWFGDGYLPKHDHFRAVVADVRNLDAFKKAVEGCDAVIHLACISNDPSCLLDESLSTSINLDAFGPIVKASKEAGVRRFIYASSSSVYGVSEATEVREDHPLKWITLYSKYKALCEPILLAEQSNRFECVVLRPATICGYAPRQRFDLTVNILTAHAVVRGVITVFGGEQKRPNLHVLDMVDCYRAVLLAPAAKVNGEVFNVGQQNLKVIDIAKLVKEIVAREMGRASSIEIAHSDDVRSYHINSDKIKRVLGFESKRRVEHAVSDLCTQFKRGRFGDALVNPRFSNVKQLLDRGMPAVPFTL